MAEGVLQDRLIKMQRKFNFEFDFYRISKNDYSIITFFDQVFDAGLNKAVPWHSYWTPLRYVLLIILADLFDDEMKRKAWAARISRDIRCAGGLLKEVCQSIEDRVDLIQDDRARQIIRDTIVWAKNNPDQIQYNCISKSDVLQISPNLIGFQFVLIGIAKRMQGQKNKNASIVVDRQEQFNSSQEWLANS